MQYILRLTSLSRYILVKYIPSLLISTIFFTTIILVFYLKEVVREAMEKNLSLLLVGELMAYSLGWTLSMTIPMAILLSVILSVSAHNSDSEVIAMRAGGISYRRISWPYVMVGLLLSGFLLWYNHFVVPGLYGQVLTKTKKIVMADPAAVIEPGQFTMIIDDETKKESIYIDEMERTEDGFDILKNIQIQTHVKENEYLRLERLIIADTGEKIKTGNRKAIRLRNGYILYKTEQDYTIIDFSTGYTDLYLVESNFAEYTPEEKEVAFFSNGQLMQKIDSWKSEKQNELVTKAYTEMGKRTALGFAALLFTIAAFPLGISNIRAGKGAGLGIAIVLIFLYFTLYLLSDAIASFGVPGYLSAWVGNIIYMVVAVVLYLQRIAEFSPRVFWATLLRR